MSGLSSRSIIRRCFSEVDVVASLRENFGANLTLLIEELKLKGVLQKDVATRLRVSTNQISQWKSGIIPEPETVEQIAEIGDLKDPGMLYVSPIKFATRDGADSLGVRILEAIRKGLREVDFDVVKINP